MNKHSLFYKRLYIFLFIVSALGFSHTFSSFVKESLLNSSDRGSVAGVYIEHPPVTVELRTNDKKIAERIVSDLSSNKNVVVKGITYISRSYPVDLLVDLTDGSKIADVSSVENTVMLGATTEMPSGEVPSNSDILLIVTSK